MQVVHHFHGGYMRSVTLNWAALSAAAAAASTGVHGHAAIVQHLGVNTEPVTMELIARVVVRFPISAADVFRVSGHSTPRIVIVRPPHSGSALAHGAPIGLPA